MGSKRGTFIEETAMRIASSGRDCSISYAIDRAEELAAELEERGYLATSATDILDDLAECKDLDEAKDRLTKQLGKFGKSFWKGNKDE